MSMATTAEIRTEGLVKIYGQRPVVNGVNINVQAGEVVGGSHAHGCLGLGTAVGADFFS